MPKSQKTGRAPLPTQYPTCRQINADGSVCHQAALRGRKYCYYHQRDRHRLRKLRSLPDVPEVRQFALDELDLPLPDDAVAIQVYLGNLIRAYQIGAISDEKAGKLAYMIQIAVTNLPNVSAHHSPRSEAAEVQVLTDPEPIISEDGFDEKELEEELEIVLAHAPDLQDLAPVRVFSPSKLADLDMLRSVEGRTRDWRKPPATAGGHPDGSLDEGSAAG